jgi:2-dehydro-3-deoxyphosphogluconate aldolase/(4S)-4-hydroxy-2-oxoglutarate aldolase
MRQKTIARIREEGIIPILRTPSADDALVLADVLFRAGMTCVEIPLTVPGALDVIRELATTAGDRCHIGAGTVLSVKDAEAAVEAGARFVISPSVDVETIRYCSVREIAVFPGALTPTEIVTAWRAGADAIKVFPVGAVGGPAYIRAVRAPLPQIPLVPTGGVTLENAGAFIRAGATAVGVGADFVDVEAIRSGNAEGIADKARRYLAAVANARS